MKTRKIVHQIGICGGLLLVLLLMETTGVMKAPTSAQEAIITPANQALTTTNDDPQLLQPLEGDFVNGVDHSRWGQFQQANGDCRTDSTCLRYENVLPDKEESQWYIPTDYEEGVCPIDSDFNGSAPGWVSRFGTWYIGASYLYTYGVAGTSSSASNINNFNNFDYQASMWRSGCDTCENRLIFRGTPDPLSGDNHWYNEYTFQYTRSGYYSVFKVINGGTSTAVVPWIFSSAINQGDAWNTLRVVAFGANLSFYINGTLLWSGTDSSLSIGIAGLGMYRTPSSTGDELRVDWARLCQVPHIYLPLVVRQ